MEYPVADSASMSSWGRHRTSPDVDCRRGLTILIPQKSLALSVTTMQPCVSDTAAMIISGAPCGWPTALPSAIKRDLTALSVNGTIRPADNACYPSLPATNAWRARRRLSLGRSRIPHWISATVIEDTNRLPSLWSVNQWFRFAAGCCLATLLMILGLRRWWVKGRSCVR